MELEVPILQTYVDGLDRVLGGGIPRGSTVLVAGTPGTMKTSLILWIMHENARTHGTKSLYVSLEQDMDSLKAGAARMGMGNLHESAVYILDMGQLRRGLHRSEEHTSELQSPCNLVCRLLLEKKKTKEQQIYYTN